MSLIDSFSYSLSNLISKYSVLTLYLLGPNNIIKKNGFAEENHNLKYILNQDNFMFQVTLVFIILVIITMFTYAAVNTMSVYAQNNGKHIAPAIKWTDNKDGYFDYCVYKGEVSLGTYNDNIKGYCLMTSEDPLINNMNTYLDDGVDLYHLNDIILPPSIIKDGQEYTVCVGFNPQSETDYSFAEKCQSFYNSQGSQVETPLINLDRNTCYDCDYD